MSLGNNVEFLDEDVEVSDDDETSRFSDDAKIQELQSLKYIYPNSAINFHNLSGEIRIPIKLDKPVVLVLKKDGRVLDRRSVVNLPDVYFKFVLPVNYPHEKPPKVTINSIVINDNKIDDILRHFDEIWSNYKDHVLYSFVDYLTQIIHYNLLDLIDIEILSPQDFQQCLEFNDIQLQKEFDTCSFTCSICQGDYKGISCLKFDNCNHIFCKPCLHDFFKSIIIAGDIERIHCPDYVCTKEWVKKFESYSKLDVWIKNNYEVEQIINTLLTPGISITILNKIFDDDQQLINRYYDLFKRSQFEFIGKLLPNRLVECPRVSCDEIIFRKDLSDQLVICHKCGYAFCNRCCNSWHSKSVICKATKSNSNQYWGVPLEDLTSYISAPKDSHDRKTLNSKYGRMVMIKAVNEYEMDLLFNKMLAENSTIVKCPDCDIFIEKINGCNKICCTKCKTYFCFICGELTGNSYDHFADSTSRCYGKLFEGMPGMEDANT